MNIDLGYLGKVVMCGYKPEDYYMIDNAFTIVSDGYTESDIRVHGVIDRRDYVKYPCVWRNSILIKVN